MTAAIRLGVVTTSFPACPGDPAGGFVAEHARWLAARGYGVDVVAARRSPGPSRAGWEPGVAVTRLAAGTLFSGEGAPETLARSPRAWLGGARYTAGLAAEILRRRHRWDAIIAHWLAPSALVAAATGGGRPLLAIAHSGDVHLLIALGLAAPAARLLAAARASVVFVSEPLRERFAAAAGGLRFSHDVCPMGIEVARFAGARPAPRGDRPVVLFLGRLVPVKGAAVLIDAVAALDQRPELRIAGAGPERSALAARAARRGVEAAFLGELRGAARDAELAAADIVAIPSIELPGGRTEGMPVVALEAMAAGAAVVASRTGGLAGLPPAAATLHRPGDPLDLARAIRALLAMPHRRRAQAEAGRHHAEAHDWSRLGPRLMTHLAISVSRCH